MAILTYKGNTFTIEGPLYEGIVATALHVKYEGNRQYTAFLKGGGSLSFQMEEEEWVAISQPDLDKYRLAKAAKKELEEARSKYRETMKSLYAIQKSSGTYEDYESWLEIPGIPGIDWEDV